MPLVARLRRAWGNEGYSADLGFLEDVVTRAVAADAPLLECGSGVSTVVLGAVTHRSGTPVWSLEQDEEWARTVIDLVASLGLDNVRVVYAPLEIIDGAAWFAFEEAGFPDHFSAVFCDGPAVRRSEWPAEVTRAWRSGVVGGLQLHGASFDCIVLDDEEDPRCEALIVRWQAAGLQIEVIESEFGRHVVAVDPSRAPTGREPSV